MILEKVRNTIERYGLIDRNDTILVGVSGGADSVALLYLLNSLKRELKINIGIAHLDHMLRDDSYKDREFVQNLAQKLKIPITATEINVTQLAKRGSLEELARNVRLGFLFSVAHQMRTKKIALGHNLDDQAETVLMRILRGSGLYGLSGILPKREIDGYQIIRPLIKVRRKEIERFLRRKRVKPRTDRSNLEDVYFRNKLRNRLIPLLEKEYNKNIKEVLSNMAEAVGYDYDYLSRISDKFLNPIRNTRAFNKENKISNGVNKPEAKINLKGFLRLHPAIQRLVLRKMIAKIQGDTRRITFKHIQEIEDLIFNRPINSIVDLPKGVSVIKTEKYLSFYRK